MQLKVNQLLLNKPKGDLSKCDAKGKEVVDIDDSEDQEERVRTRRSRTRGLKRVLEQQKGQMIVDEIILAEIEKDKVGWLDRVNFHLQ